jgi:hypothetical protein
MRKIVLLIMLLFIPVVRAAAATPDTCSSSAFIGVAADPDSGSGSEMFCEYSCRDGLKIRITRMTVDRLGGGIFTVFDAAGKVLYRGYTDIGYERLEKSPGVLDPVISSDSLAEKFCPE